MTTEVNNGRGVFTVCDQAVDADGDNLIDEFVQITVNGTSMPIKKSELKQALLPYL